MMYKRTAETVRLHFAVEVEALAVRERAGSDAAAVAGAEGASGVAVAGEAEAVGPDCGELGVVPVELPVPVPGSECCELGGNE